MTLRMLRHAWWAFGRLLDFAPRPTAAGRTIRHMQREFSRRSDAAAIGRDYRQVGSYLRSSMKKFDG